MEKRTTFMAVFYLFIYLFVVVCLWLNHLKKLTWTLLPTTISECHWGFCINMCLNIGRFILFMRFSVKPQLALINVRLTEKLPTGCTSYYSSVQLVVYIMKIVFAITFVFLSMAKVHCNHLRFHCIRYLWMRFNESFLPVTGSKSIKYFILFYFTYDIWCCRLRTLIMTAIKHRCLVPYWWHFHA